MKLRIRGNLLRFRLGRSEVRGFGSTGRIEECVSFGVHGPKFRYSIEKTADTAFSSSFSDGSITVRIPTPVVDRWVEGDEVGIEGKQRIDEETELGFLIEKDFACLSAHDDEDQSDKYPHPNGEQAC